MGAELNLEMKSDHVVGIIIVTIFRLQLQRISNVIFSLAYLIVVTVIIEAHQGVVPTRYKLPWWLELVKLTIFFHVTDFSF